MPRFACPCWYRWIRYAVWTLSGVLGGVGETQAEPRDWALSNGVTIRAEYIAKIGENHWLRESPAGLHKLGLATFSAADAEFIRALLAGPTAAWDGTGMILVLERPKGRAEEMLETLARTALPAFRSDRQSRLRDVFDKLSDAIAEVAPERGKIEFPVHPECAGRDANVDLALRNMSAWLALQIIVENSQVRMVVQADHIEVLPRIWPARATATPAVLPVGESTSEFGEVCSAAAGAKGYLQHGDFEQDAPLWELRNQPGLFQRVGADEALAHGRAPELGATVMRINLADGIATKRPPLITQTVKFPARPGKVRMCANVLYVGPQEREVGMRLSASDPNVEYGERTQIASPSSDCAFWRPREWWHVEAVFDWSLHQSEEVVFGWMFWGGRGVWYLDGLRVTAE